MALSYQFDDAKLEGFSQAAKTALVEELGEFADQLTEESVRIEAGRKPKSGPKEITKSMVHSAANMSRLGLGARKTPLLARINRVASIVLSVLCGVLYDPKNLQDNNAMALFVIVLALTAVSATVSVMKE